MAVLFLTCSAAWAQAPSAPVAPASTLESSATEVSLDMVVRDRKDRAVGDLTPDELVVTDQGAPVKLLSLRVAAGVPGEPRLVALVFDRFDGGMGKSARILAGKILKGIPNQDFQFSVFSVDGRLRLLQAYTADRGLVERGVASATEAPGSNLGADAAGAEKALLAKANTAAGEGGLKAADREAARSLVAAIGESQRLADDQRFLDHRQASGLAALTALAGAAGKMPGRKVVLYFTAGIDADTRALDMVKTTVGAANRAEVSIYPIDISAMGVGADEGLVAQMAMGSIRTNAAQNPAPAAGPPVANVFLDQQTPPGMQQAINDNTTNLELGDREGGPGPLGRLARGTGGRYIPAQMNISKQIRQLVEDTDNFYIATYIPPIDEYDGSFRAITVKPLRKNISIRARSGYYALPPGETAGMRPFEMPLLNLLRQTQPPAEFDFRSQIVQLGELPGGLTQELVVETPIEGLEFRRDPNAGLFTLHATLLAQIVDSSGGVVEQFSQELRRHGALDKLDAARDEVWNFQRPFVAAPGKYTMKVAMMDLNGGKSAVEFKAFEIAAPSGPFLSDVVVVRRTEPVSQGKSAHDSFGDPLGSSNGLVVPNLSAVLSPGAKKVSLFFVIHPGQAALGKASLEMTVSRGGRVIGRAPLNFREAADNSPVPYFGTLGTGSMSAGEYVATLRLAQGEQSFERRVAFKVSGTEEAPGIVTVAGESPAGKGGADTAPEDASAALPPLVVTPAGPGAPVQSPEEIKVILDNARKGALAYADKLPNFLCAEVTNRSLDPSGTGRWKRQDSYTELLTYRNHAESRRVIAVNGHETHESPDEMKGMVSHGEFGGILNSIFDPAAKTDFLWKESGFVNGQQVDVFEYRVASKDSSFGLTGDNNWQINAAFHGLVSIDAATFGVRQATLIADDLPKEFSIRASAIRIDYDYIAINEHDYLLPTRATISLRRHKHEGVLNEIEFRDYRRFGAKARMVPMAK